MIVRCDTCHSEGVKVVGKLFSLQMASEPVALYPILHLPLRLHSHLPHCVCIRKTG